MKHLTLDTTKHFELTPEQISTFQNSGYLVLPDKFTKEEVHQMQLEANRLLEFLINSSLANHRRSGRLDIKQLPSGKHIIRKIQPIVDISPKFSALAKDERLLTPLRQLQGEEPALMEEKFSYKQPLPEPIEGIEVHLADDRFLLHQDYNYHVQHGYRPDILTYGVVLDDCTLESGPLRVWPGTHRELIPHETVTIGNYRSYQVPESLINFQDAVDITVPRGTLLLFHDLLVHSSSVNRTQQPRRILFFSYCPTSTPIDFDTRNSPTRVAELSYESRYQMLKEQGLFTDTFRVPVLT
ncbi:hypothetical protein FACHB389_25325 [Nostoc calcicola FACHB-389]|nr:phytanoyl-CoA dioxygenase family protein [Nostoc calcicola FACHB-3891]OKH29902.1 hypothetical protein FACHB389_25325 [Nostoc calcicola FACHB-389]